MAELDHRMRLAELIQGGEREARWIHPIESIRGPFTQRGRPSPWRAHFARVLSRFNFTITALGYEETERFSAPRDRHFMLRHETKKKEGGGTMKIPWRTGEHVDSQSSTTPVLFAVSFDTIMELSKSNERWGGGLPPAAISTAARIYIVTLVSMLLPLGNTGQFTLPVRDRRVYIYIYLWIYVKKKSYARDGTGTWGRCPPRGRDPL